MHLNNYASKKPGISRGLRAEYDSRAERRIWKTLLSKRQTGERFLRQQTIGGLTADFFCPDLNLIVEIDKQTDFLHPHYHVVRFCEDEIVNRLEEVTEKIQHLIGSLKENQ